VVSCRPYMRIALLVLSVLVAHRPAAAQIADHYLGTVVNDDMTGQPAELELFIYARSDSGTIGWMKVGNPLGGSGATAVVARDLDSLYLVTVTTTGDTLIWAAPQRTGTLEGRYWIKGTNYDGQGGRWRLVPQPRISKAALFLFAVAVGALCILALAALSAARYQRWWGWRANPVCHTADDRRKLSGVQGWLAWFVLGQSLLAIYLLVTIRDAVDLLGGTWMLGAAINGMRPLLFLEAVGHCFQLFGIVLGLFLIRRHSQLAPIYWVTMLSLAAVYAFVDILGASGIRQVLATMFGPDAAGALRGMQEATTQNFRVIFNAAIWSLYWIRSRRVFVVFGPAAPLQTVSAVEPVMSSVQVPKLPSIAG